MRAARLAFGWVLCTVVFASVVEDLNGMFSGALLPRDLLKMACDQTGQAHEVVSGAAEDEDPFHLVQPAQLYLAE